VLVHGPHGRPYVPLPDFHRARGARARGAGLVVGSWWARVSNACPTAEIRKRAEHLFSPLTCGFPVAGAGFEPATSGL
jgi:hypothetical protein